MAAHCSNRQPHAVAGAAPGQPSAFFFTAPGGLVEVLLRLRLIEQRIDIEMSRNDFRPLVDEPAVDAAFT
ncbi:MAG TPA: hypothetical protein VFI62_10720 [Burkholderiales bacterium]|nr:hypothetical protein [Burkholderiales bacterium]